jgi:Na+-transporting NADH:ubiquinone oxidoreductase subunit NqrB
MKKIIIVACLASLGMLILIKSGMIESLVLFLLVGIIPGTNYAIPSSVMLMAIFSILWLLVIRFAALELFYMFIDRRTISQKTTHKKRMPKRRYSQI